MWLKVSDFYNIKEKVIKIEGFIVLIFKDCEIDMIFTDGVEGIVQCKK